MAQLFQNAVFVLSAATPKQFIRDRKPQIVFAGRSNVGKSSIINCLCQRKNLAHVGATPGKTSQVNYFSLDGKYYLTDLPGYGFARVSKDEKDRWASLMEDYFASMDGFLIGLLILDIRHEPTEDDQMMFRWFKDHHCPMLLIANKCDKLKKAEIDSSLSIMRDIFGSSETIIPFSAVKGIGKDDVIKQVNSFLK